MTHIVTLPGIRTSFAVGMVWRHEDRVPNGAALRRLSQQAGRWGCVRKTITGAIQVGFAKPIEGVSRPSKLRSLAACVADQRPQPWMATYPIGDGRYWHIAVRNGQQILLDGDRIGTFEEVNAIKNRQLTLGDWEIVENPSIEDLVEMVHASTRQVALRDLQARPWSVAIQRSAAAVLLLAVCAAAWVAVKRFHHVQPAIAVVQSIPVIDAHPWTKLPDTNVQLEAWREAWHGQDLARKGWQLTNWKCQTSGSAMQVHTEWLRAGGLAQDAPGTLSSDGNHSSGDETLTQRFMDSGQETLFPDAARRALMTIAQSYGFAVTPASDKSESGPGWTATPITLSMESPPWLGLATALASVSGLRLSDIDWNETNGRWTVTGKLYSQTSESSTAPLPAPEMNQRRVTKPSSRS